LGGNVTAKDGCASDKKTFVFCQNISPDAGSLTYRVAP
jgi:hypothetical protein